MQAWIRLAAVLAALAGAGAQGAAQATTLQSVAVKGGAAQDAAVYDGVVEAVRQSVIAAQVAGAIVSLNVKAGDSVKAGQVLLRIDARAAQQATLASQQQVLATRSALEVATRDYERQKTLYQQKYISQAALERAEAQFKATSAQLNAEMAQSSAAAIQSDYYVVTAPYAGVVAEVPVVQGDMAMPGRALVTLYDPARLRVTAALPQSALAQVDGAKPAAVELPALGGARPALGGLPLQVLPIVDAGSHAGQVRIDLPAGLTGLVPGMFARVTLPLRAADKATAENGKARLSVPAAAIVRRAEMTGLYVLDAQGRPLLRQVRLGQARGADVEVLAGVNAGERVALDPAAAARVAK